KLVPIVADMMKRPYPELQETVKRVSGVIEKEEANFFGTIDAGLNHIDRVFDEMRRDNHSIVNGAVAAELYQTYGVPPELFESLAAEHNFAFDWQSYEHAMEEHGEVSGKVQHAVMGARGPVDSLKQALHSTEFLGYEKTEAEAVIKGIIAGTAPDDHLCDQMDEVGHENKVRVVLDRTPFYGESGGQVGDTGKLVGDGFEFHVTDTQKDGGLFIHEGHLTKGVMREGAKVKAVVDTNRRAGIRRAHSATHILHYALQKNLGTHAQQQGSKVDEDWLRFDFTNLSPVSGEQLAVIGTDVVEQIAKKEPVKWETLPLVEARKQGAMMLFGEKYPDPVRMVSMGAFSKELCGGTHLTNTGEVGQFEILSEEGVSAGTRRITALTGARAKEHVEQIRAAGDQVAKLLGVGAHEIANAATALSNHARELRKQLSSGSSASSPQPKVKSDEGKANVKGSFEQVKHALAEAGRHLSVAMLAVPQRIEALKTEIAGLEKQLAERSAAGPLSGDRLLEAAEQVGDVTVLVVEVPGVEANLMRQLIDQVRGKTQSSAVLLASRQGDDKVTLVAGISKDLQAKKLSAGEWIRPVAGAVGGGGGGRPDMAQAGGKEPAKLPEALQIAKDTIRKMLG
ncbi:MAG TPA: alanine--tRNA ligase-related protein, partial [Lacipirellulaceae bacterium]|nr:alanine--tRNA ligase-related protein [Lacipirellulaceae bacterium]